jgi:hypothetical protein
MLTPVGLGEGEVRGDCRCAHRMLNNVAHRGCSERPKIDPSKLACIRYPRDGPDKSPTARSFLTRPPIGTPRRAISPGEGFLVPTLHHHTFSSKGVAGLSFTARIGRAPFHRARSVSKKDGLATPFTSFLGRVLREQRGLTRPSPPCWQNFSVSR